MGAATRVTSAGGAGIAGQERAECNADGSGTTKDRVSVPLAAQQARNIYRQRELFRCAPYGAFRRGDVRILTDNRNRRSETAA